MSVDHAELFSFLERYDVCSLADVPSDLLCSICGRVLNNAYFGPCTCQYCFKCINKVLANEGQKLCPGNNKACKRTKLDSTKQLKMAEYTNQKIAVLEIKCPNTSCTFRDCIDNMVDHVRVCVGQLDKCPYSLIGCKSVNIKAEEIEKHLACESFGHAKILIDFLVNMKNLINSLNDNKQEMNVGNEANVLNDVKVCFEMLKDTLNRQQVDIDQINSTISSLTTSEQGMQSSVQTQSMELENLRNAIETLKTNSVQPAGASAANTESSELLKKTEFQTLKKELQQEEKKQNKLLNDFISSQKGDIERLDQRVEMFDQCMFGSIITQRETSTKIAILSEMIGTASKDVKEMKKKFDDLQKELKTLKEDVQKLTEKLQKNDPKKDNVQKNVASIEKEIQKLKEGSTEISDIKKNIEMLESVQAECLQKLVNVEELIKRTDGVEKLQDECNKQIDEFQKRLKPSDDVVFEKSEPYEFQKRPNPYDDVVFEKSEPSYVSMWAAASEKCLTEFIWKIENVSLMKRENAGNRDIMYETSDPFYSETSNGYRFCMLLLPNSMGKWKNSHIFIGFSVLQGDFDEYLEWPCRLRIQLSIVKQDDRTDSFIRMYQYEISDEKYKKNFERPMDNIIRGIGCPNFLDWDNLKRSKRIYRNDTISVRCKIYSAP